MKLLGTVVLALSLAGFALGITDLLRAGTNAARGSIGAGNSLVNMGLGNSGRNGYSSQMKPAAGGNAPSSSPMDAAQAFSGRNSPMSGALGSVRSATNAAANVGDTALSTISTAISMSSILAHPWTLYLIDLYTRIMAYFR